MPNLKFDFSRHICAVGQNRFRALPPDGAPPPSSLTHLSWPEGIQRDTHLVSRWSSATTEVYWVKKGAFVCQLNNCLDLISYYDYFNKLLRLENVKLFSRQDNIIDILVTKFLILYRKLYINIVSIIVLNIESRQYNIKNNIAISCSPTLIRWKHSDWRAHRRIYCTFPAMITGLETIRMNLSTNVEY